MSTGEYRRVQTGTDAVAAVTSAKKHALNNG